MSQPTLAEPAILGIFPASPVDDIWMIPHVGIVPCPYLGLSSFIYSRTSTPLSALSFSLSLSLSLSPSPSPLRVLRTSYLDEKREHAVTKTGTLRIHCLVWLLEHRIPRHPDQIQNPNRSGLGPEKSPHPFAAIGFFFFFFSFLFFLPRFPSRPRLSH
ncbi:hypothetical protein LX36DRAFT_182368 [Colletotrichum falcatum]|nr:hypothetical protein LX36DRAFT_182368 [Colletotrichum falcatum]